MVGVPDIEYGEIVGAFLELKAGNKRPRNEEVKKWVSAKLAHFKAPVHICWLRDKKVPEEWPKTVSGKISKPELRKIAQGIVEAGEAPKAKLC